MEMPQLALRGAPLLRSGAFGRPFRPSCCQRQMVTTAHGLYGNSDWSRADLADPVAIGQEIIQHIRHSRGVGQGGACGRANFFFYRDYYVYLYVESVRNERSRSCLLRPAVGDDSGRRGASSPWSPSSLVECCERRPGGRVVWRGVGEESSAVVLRDGGERAQTQCNG